MTVKMSSPVKGYVTSEYGTRNGSLHAGIDIATGGKSGKVHATFAGTIERIVSGRKPGNRTTDSYAPGRTGNYIVVRNPDRERQLYNHTVATGVSVGDNVAIGDVIGKTDLSGNSTGYHCHYEEWDKNGKTRNPRVSFAAFDVSPGAAPVKGKDGPAAPSTGTRTTLKRGMTGEDVKALQRRLNDFKATPDKRWPDGDLLVDGKYGSYTEARVKDWQRRNHGGLYPRVNTIDGVAGPVTRKALGL